MNLEKSELKEEEKCALSGNNQKQLSLCSLEEEEKCALSGNNQKQLSLCSPPDEDEKENVENSSASSGGARHSQKILRRSIGLLQQITHNETNWSMQQEITKQFPNKCRNLLRELRIQDSIMLDEFANLPELFAVIQAKGLLSGKILKYFSHVPGISSMNYTPTYGRKLGNTPYLTVFAPSKNPQNCTVPLYRGFGELEMLDLNNVEITDNELRFIIRLGNLKALGLGWSKISVKGLAFLVEYASFVGCLECLMLGGNGELGDLAVESICKFTALQDLDIEGTGISLMGIRRLGILMLFGGGGGNGSDFEEKTAKCSLSSIKITRSIALFLQDMHVAFQNHQWKTWNDSEISYMERHQIVQELKAFGNSYGDFCAYQNTESLRCRLMQIVRWRRIEEFIWSILTF